MLHGLVLLSVSLTLPADWTTVGLWLAVIGIGIYHGVNPGMGWPLAVSAGLMGKGRRDVVRALVPLASGHLLAMAIILLPFAAVAVLLTWERQIRFAAAALVIAAGLYLLINRRHPRILARIRPTQLALWSFAVATAHGAGLMLLPVYLGLCRAEGTEFGHQAAAQLMSNSLLTAASVAIVHTVAMVASGGLLALAVHGWLGLNFIRRSWFNLDTAWAASLILVGGISLASLLFAA